MKKLSKVLWITAVMAVLFTAAAYLVFPWMDRWGANEEEISAVYPGDELVPNPARLVNHGITIEAAPEQIYPWIVQLGAGRGGYYSYSWLETNMLLCPLENADFINPEWQNLQVGDTVKMCPGETAPPPYTVARLEPDQAVILGHKDGDNWVETWQFIILPQSDSTSRLIVRSRTMMEGGFWSVIQPGVFIMERGMMLGIKERAEMLAEQESGNDV